MLRLYGDENLPAVERVCFFLEEKAVDFSVSSAAPPVDVVDQSVVDDILDGGPVIIGDDDTAIAGVTPVCRYLEELYPAPPMLGSTALEQAHVEMWQRYVENKILSPLGIYFFHGKCADEFPDHQKLTNTAWAEENRQLLLDSYARVDMRLSDTQYLCGSNFTIADITLFSSVRFGELLELEIPACCQSFERWRADIVDRFDNPWRNSPQMIQEVAVMH